MTKQRLVKKPGPETITGIAQLIREGKPQDNENSDVKKVNSTNSKDIVLKENETDSSSDYDVFEELIEIIKNKNYRTKGVLYVDEDIKEIFSLLKAKGKLPIAGLVSYILEDWLSENAEKVSQIINSKNRLF